MNYHVISCLVICILEGILYFYQMTKFDQIFFIVFTAFKGRYKQKANSIALIHNSILQIALLFLVGVFIAVFFSKMNVSSISSGNAWGLFFISAIGIHLKNWLKYNGKTVKVLSAKFNKKKSDQQNVKWLIAAPFICVVFALLLLQSL